MNDLEKTNIQAILIDIASKIQDIDCGLSEKWFEEIADAIRDI